MDKYFYPCGCSTLWDYKGTWCSSCQTECGIGYEPVKLALLNTTIVTTNGLYEIKSLTSTEARELFASYGDNIDSAIGHESTAGLFSTLIGGYVPMNRQTFVQKIGQKALVLKLKGRPQEGAILTLEQIEGIGYEFKLMERLS